MIIPIPTVETERLLLRGWREADFEPFAQLMADPEITGHLIAGPHTRTDAWHTIARTIGHWVLRGFGPWAVERKEDGALIGRIGLTYPEGWPGMEVGWTLGRPYWGKGYATEAARASLDYGFEHYPVAELISVIDIDNFASQRVAARIGETKGAQIDLTSMGKTYRVDIWGIARETWEEQRSKNRSLSERTRLL